MTGLITHPNLAVDPCVSGSETTSVSSELGIRAGVIRVRPGHPFGARAGAWIYEVDSPQDRTEADRLSIGDLAQEGEKLRSLGAAERLQETYLRPRHDRLKFCKPTDSAPSHRDDVAATV